MTGNFTGLTPAFLQPTSAIMKFLHEKWVLEACQALELQRKLLNLLLKSRWQDD